MSTTVPKAPTGAVPAIGVPDSQDYPRLVYTAPYFAQTPLAELIEPSVIEAAEAVLPELVPPYVQGAADAAVDQRAVLLTGSTMSGPLYLNPAIPTQPSQAASMAYVDMLVSTGPVPEVPPVPFGQTWARQTGAWVPALSDAPNDGTAYGRLSHAWSSVLPLSGGTMSGPLNYTATGSTTSRAAQDRATDAVNIRDFGAISDGNSHPLSARFSTLAAAQAVFPVAIALTDETDWCAIQMTVNALPLALRIVGNAVINRPIVSSTTAVTVIGDGQYVASITQTGAGQDGWQHTSSQPFEMFGLNLQCTGAGGAALNLNFSGSATRFTMRDVRIAGNGSATTNYWHDGIKAVGCSRTTIEHCLIVGNAGAPLANVGNGIYLAPQTTPSAAGSFIIRVSDCIINNWQSGIVFDATGRTTAQNIQGAVLDWVNCNQCMQFVTVLGSILELVLHKCQAEQFGSAINAQNATSVVVRDCMFFFDPPTANAIAAQLPQDCIYINQGGNWIIAGNRFVFQANAPVNYVYNILGSAGGVVIRDNSVFCNTGSTATGLISIASGVHHVQETGSLFSFWGAWPLCTNANQYGGTANNTSFGPLVTGNIAALTSDTWQNQGAFVAWNYPAGSGALALVSSHGAGAGGINFYNTQSDRAQTPYLIASFGDTGSTLGQNTGNNTVRINGGAGSGRNLAWTSAGSTRWNAFADTTAESGSNAGSNFNIASYTDAGTLIGTALSIVRATGVVAINSGTLAIGAASGPTITQGAAAPAATQPVGSLYMRVGGAVGATLYVSRGGGTWAAVAGV